MVILYCTDNTYQEPYPNCYNNIDLLGMVKVPTGPGKSWNLSVLESPEIC